MAFKLAEAYVELKQQGFESFAQQTAKVRSELTQTTTAAGGMVGALSTMRGTLGAIGLAKFSTDLTSTVANMLKLAASAEDTALGYEVLLGSATKAKAMIADMRRFAADTPLRFTDVSQAGQTLLGFGVDSGRIMPMIRMLGDVSGGNSQRFQSMALAFGQVSAAGRLMGQDLLQMINAGFNPLQEISKRTGRSIAELKVEMEAGRISVQQVTQAMVDATSEGGRFYQNMEKRGQGLLGLWNQLADAAERVNMTLGEKLVQGLGVKDAIKGAEVAVSGLADALGKVDLSLVSADSKWSKLEVQLRRVALLGSVGGVLNLFGTLGDMSKGGKGPSEEDIAALEGMQATLLGTKVGATAVQDYLAYIDTIRQMRDEASITDKAFQQLAAAAGKDAGIAQLMPGTASDSRLEELERARQLLADIDAQIAQGDVPGLMPVRQGLADKLAEATGATKRLAEAREELRRASLGKIRSATEEARDAGWTDEQIGDLRQLLQDTEDAAKRARGAEVGKSVFAQLAEEVAVLDKSMTPLAAKLAELKRQGVGEGQLGEIGKLLAAKEALQKAERRKTIFQQIAEDADLAAKRIDPVDQKLREMAKAGASEAELKTAAELLIGTTKDNQARKAAGPQFVGASELNKTIQGTVGKDDVGLRQVGLLQRIADAVEFARQNGDGTAGRAGLAALGGRLGGFGGLVGALMGGGGLAGFENLGNLVGATPPGDAMRHVGDLMEKMNGGGLGGGAAQEQLAIAVKHLEKLVRQVEHLGELAGKTPHAIAIVQ